MILGGFRMPWVEVPVVNTYPSSRPESEAAHDDVDNADEQAGPPVPSEVEIDTEGWIEFGDDGGDA